MEPSRATVIVPLYIWPCSSADWQPLFDTILAHPSVEFLVIINPSSGPGAEPLPGHDYEREIPKLNASPNVTTIGYVRIDYCRKPLHDACEEIDRYAGWMPSSGSDVSGLGLQGIYLDETPNHFSAGRRLYLEALHQHIKNTEGLLGQRLVVHNPGTPPDADLASPAVVDIIVTCEEPYQKYAGDETQQRLQDYFIHRSRSAYQISGVPKELIREVTRELRRKGAYVFATSLTEDFYEDFGACWKEFVTAMKVD
ncbi:cell surface protein [Cucurbitaria berberidis CBS 394.84]|uniref:Cell surface protein n=1 Tax=Cucurbitaria berberidis CBS 394.84 TaxID=1168544 RepID=A0A9P4GQ74_9PLEO|nr:cell surface protein [Cucurbitaria berberidis CBS 394.84]KAF1850683.1 cell surface protein [Cucurbitaria berberidis CBS 394.84]